MKSIILWNNDKYGETLNSVLKGSYLISNTDDFLENVREINSYNAILILCELNWSFDNKSANISSNSFSGIEIAKELRRVYNINLPIIFCSFLQLKEVYSSNTEILTTIGHNFIQLPFSIDLLNNLLIEKSNQGCKLSQMELNDIKSFYCDKEGILIRELHAINHFLNIKINEENQVVIYQNFLNIYLNICDLFSFDKFQSEIEFKNIYSNITNENINQVVQYITHKGNEFLKNINKSESNEYSSNNKFPWKILLLDDEINKDHELIKQMQINNINVICVDNADDAEDELKKDWKKENSIMVVIADYRLYNNINGIKHHQKVQGYQFLKNITTSDHLVRLVAFSGLQRKFLLNSFKHFNIRTEVKSKTDYLNTKETRQLFCEEMIELAEENWEAIEALPTKCAGFENNLKDAYKEFRLHPDYNKKESNISITSREYIWEIQQQIANGEEIRIGAIENIKSPLAKTKKDPEAFFKRLQNYLTARRIALWLYAANKKGLGVFIDSRRIAEILTDQKYPTDAYRQILSTNLGLSLDDFPKNITIEERRWLHYDMQLNVLRDIEQMNPVFIKLSKVYKEYIAADKSLEELLSKSKHLLHHKYKLTDYSISFTKDFSPELKTSTDVRVLFLWIAGIIKKDKSKLSSIKPLVSKLRFTLFQSRDRVIYLKNLFEYFNAIFSILFKEQVVLANPSAKVKDKSTFQEKSVSKRNDSFDRAYQLLLEGELPNDKDSADVFILFLKGEDVIREQGSEILKDKARFLSKVTKAINDENRPLGNSLDEGFGKHNPSDDYDWQDDSDLDEDFDFPEDELD